VEKIIGVFSSSRSGSTWIGKILDSHPEVFYLHEPDIDDRGLDLLPYWFADSAGEADAPAARAYFERLLSSRSGRAVGSRPFFLKAYRSPAMELSWRALALGARGAERVGFPPVKIPILMNRQGPMVRVIKTVSALGRVGRFVKAVPEMLPVLILRHPCGYAWSRLEGHRQALMPLPPGIAALMETPTARRLGLLLKPLEGIRPVEQLAWEWLIGNSEALEGMRASRGLVISYDLLARSPRRGARKIFESLGLSYPEQTAQFVKRAGKSDGGYYSPFRVPRGTPDWQTGLSPTEISKIRAIVTLLPLGKLFFSDLETPEAVPMARPEDVLDGGHLRSGTWST
jgi:Sulfotransferase family